MTLVEVPITCLALLRRLFLLGPSNNTWPHDHGPSNERQIAALATPSRRLGFVSQVITQPLQEGSREPVEKHRKKLEESDEKSESFGIL